MLQTWVNTFLHDQKVQIALLVVLVDFVLGVTAALKLRNFRFSYVADFLRNDIAFKLLPYFAIYVFALVAAGVDLVIPGLDLGVIATGVYGVVMLAWVGSILSSIATLFPGVVTKGGESVSAAKVAVFGSENAAPPKD